MTFRTGRRVRLSAHNHRSLPPNNLPQTVVCGAAAALVSVLCVQTFCNLDRPAADRIAALVDRGDKLDVAAARGDKLSISADRGARRLGSNVLASLFDSRFFMGDRPQTFASNAPLRPDSDASPPVQPQTTNASRHTPAAAKPVAPAAPRLASAPTKNAAVHEAMQEDRGVSDAPAPTPSIFERLFGKPAPLTLAYAAADDAGLGTARNIVSRYDQWTAVYDISAHTVYMPDGTRLEAHSGLGSLLDNPDYADEKMRGVTPPNIYDLELRESLFHGVQALRMIPEDERKTFGRSGLLAHTYMLGPNGDSNGCVSFRNYDSFLQAYLTHKVKRLAVVARLD
jgi:Protein of unknown function (DUF2778)